MIESTTINTSIALRKCSKYFNDRIFKNIEGHYWIAGGAIREWLSEEYEVDEELSCDIDLYFPNEHEFEKTYSNLKNNGIGRKVLLENDNCVKLDTSLGKIDLVKKFYPTPKETLENFDFVVCCAAVQRYYGVFYHHKDYFRDLATKIITINCSSNPLNTMLRIQKYNLKGYKAENSVLVNLAREISSLEIGDINKFVKQLGYKSLKMNK